MDVQQGRLEALFSISTEISSTLRLEEVLQRVVAHACRLMEARVASLLLKEADALKPAATYGASAAYLAQPDRDLAKSLTGEVIRTGRPLYIADVRKETQYSVSELAQKEGLCSLLSVPLHTKTEVIGVLNVFTAEQRYFDEADIRLLTLLAAQSAIAIDNARLHQDEMEAREQLRQSEKLAALGKLSAGLAHEIRNPLNTVSMLMYAMSSELPSGSPFCADLRVMQGELRRMSLLIEQFLEFAKPRLPQFQRERIDEIMEETLLLIGPEARVRKIMIYKEWEKTLPTAWIDGAQLKQVFLNILLNALQAMSHGGKLTVRIHVSGGSILTAISDEGEGIHPDVRANLFQPFFTTKKGGTGLGLSISQRIIEAHSGRLRILSQPGTGTTVVVRLPL
jgi:two-component system, NtrC family, sensor kinase